MRRLLLHRMPALNNIARLPWIKGNIRKLEKGGSLWEPSRLFDNGEQGAWYDPSDLSTMFQDSAGTTPVTADLQSVGLILDKSKGLVLGPELVVNGNFASGTSTGWTMTFNASGSSVINEEFNVVVSGGSGGFYQDLTVVMGSYYEVSVLMRKVSGAAGVRIQFFDGASFTNAITQSSYITTVGSATKYTFRIRTTLSSVLRVYLFAQDATTGGFDNVSAKLLPGNHASQATAASRPLYKTDGTYHWLQFDGVDDSLRTEAINFTATDKMSTFIGYRMTGSGTYRTIIELSADSAANDGSFGILGSNNAPTGNYLYCRGTNFATGQSMFPSNKNVFTTLWDLSKSTIATELTARRNSVPDSLTYSGAASAGNGPFGNYPIFMGAKGGVSSIFGGNAYSIIIRGALSTTQQITDTETWVNGKTGAF